MNGAPRLDGTAVVVLNYRTPHKTIRAVHSVQNSRSPAAAIIVVDNASDDGSSALLQASLPGIRLITNTHNDGFSAGCNIGIRQALESGVGRVLLLNSDVIVPADMLGQLEKALDGDHLLGIVGPLVLSSTNPECVESAGIAYSRRTGRMRHRDFGRARSAVQEFTTHIVDGVSGCAMLIRRDVIERIGLLAEEYFFGFEDLDYCLRARQAGLLTACAGRTFVLHEGSVSIGRTSRLRVYYATRNHLLLSNRFGASSRVARWIRAANVMALNAAFAATVTELPRREALAGFASGVRDYFAGRFHRAASLPATEAHRH